jgi:hypothetical protein
MTDLPPHGLHVRRTACDTACVPTWHQLSSLRPPSRRGGPWSERPRCSAAPERRAHGGALWPFGSATLSLKRPSRLHRFDPIVAEFFAAGSLLDPNKGEAVLPSCLRRYPAVGISRGLL